MEFERPITGEIVAELRKRRGHLQVLVGARQVGKTTAPGQVERWLGWRSHTGKFSLEFLRYRPSPEVPYPSLLLGLAAAAILAGRLSTLRKSERPAADDAAVG